MSLFRKQHTMFARILYTLAGAFLYAIAVNGLLVPHKLLSGGVTGVAMIFYYLLRTPVGLLVFLINIPIFIVGYRHISKRFVGLSLLGTVAVSVILLITKSWIFPVENPIIAAIFGGIMAGAGTGLVFRQRGSLGGVDIISVLVNKYFSFSIGFVTMAINFVILAIAAVIFNVELSMLTMISMYVASVTVDKVQEGFNHRKTVIIVSDKWEEIGPRLLKEVKRGVTYLSGEGAFTGKEKKLIYCIVKTLELAKLKEIIHQIDPEAFVSVTDTREVMGKGFGIADLF